MYGVPKTDLSLEEYWQVLQISECQAYGIRNVPDEITSGCDEYWNQRERYWLAFSIAKAEERLLKDRWLGFPLRRTYFPATIRSYESLGFAGKWLQGIGVETEALVEQVSFSLMSDPVEFTVAVGFTDVDELILKYPTAYFSNNCADYVIRPSCVTIAGGVATVQVPRCRLLKPEFFINYNQVTNRPDYDDDANFLDTVDVYRNYLDQTQGANIIWYRTPGQIACGHNSLLCDCGSGSPGVCSDTRQTVCSKVIDPRNGYFQVEPATYAAGSWTRQSHSIKCRRPDALEIATMRGKFDRYDDLPEDIVRAVIAIAHNNMPEDYCKCSVQQKYFEDDNRALEPPVRLGLGPSTWGIYEASEIIHEFDRDRSGHNGGFL